MATFRSLIDDQNTIFDLRSAVNDIIQEIGNGAKVTPTPHAIPKADGNGNIDPDWIFSGTSFTVSGDLSIDGDITSTTGQFNGDGSGLTGTASDLRAQDTTASDVGLGNVDNLSADEIRKGAAVNIIDSTDDLDSLSDGWYAWDTSQPANSPGSEYNILLHQTISGEAVQIAFGDIGTASMAVRTVSTGTWTYFVTDTDLNNATSSNPRFVWQNRNADFTAALNSYYALDSSSGPLTVQLPAGSEDNQVHFFLVNDTLNNNITIDPTPEGDTIEGLSEAMVVEDTNIRKFTLDFDGSTWRVY